MPDFSPLASGLLRLALGSTVLLGLAALVCRRSRQPVRRARLIELALLGCLSLPALHLAPGLPRLWLGWPTAPAAEANAAAPAGPLPGPEWPVPGELPPGPSKSEEGVAGVSAPVPVPECSTRAIARPSWQAGLVAFYLAGVTVLSLRWLLGFARLACLHAGTTPAPASVRHLFDAIAGPAGRGVALRTSDSIALPIAYGWWRPVILLPTGLGTASERALRYCLAHEWGHVERRDSWRVLLAALVQTVFFFQPLAWWLSRHLRLCQDMLADARAAAEAPLPEDYAGYLVALARTRRAPLPALGMAASGSALSKRIRMLLDDRVPLERTCRLTWTASALAVVLLSALAVSAIHLGPPPVRAAAPAVPEEKKDTKIPKDGTGLTYHNSVVEKGTNKPIPGAQVLVRRSLNKGGSNRILQVTEHVTDRDGKYTFTIPPEQVAEPSLYIELDVIAPKHAPQKGVGYALGMILQNEKLGGRPFFEKVELNPGKEVFGVLETPEGKPAAGVRITAYSRAVSKTLTFGSFDKTTTDSKGRFRFIVNTPGEAALWVEPDDYAVTAHILKERRGDLGTVVLRRGIRFRGKLVDVRGKPLPGVFLEIERDSRDAKDEVVSLVADLVRREAKTDKEGRFAVRPFLPGKYWVSVKTYVRDGERGYQRVQVPGVFLRQPVVLQEGKAPDEVELRAVPHVWIEAQYLDGKGKPRSGHQVNLFGTLDKVFWYGTGTPDPKGKIRFLAPHGLTGAQLRLLTNEHSSLRCRPGPGKPLSNASTVDLGTLEGDVKGIEIIRYHAPILLIQAVDGAGKPIEKFAVSAYYAGEPRGNSFSDLEGTETEVVFEKQEDGRRRSSQLLPDQELEFTVRAKSYRAHTGKVKLAEGVTRELRITLEKE